MSTLLADADRMCIMAHLWAWLKRRLFMRKFCAAMLPLVLAGCISVKVRISETEPTRRPECVADDSFFEAYCATRRFSLGAPRSVGVTPDGSAVLFLRSGPRSFVQDLYAFDTKTGSERLLLTAAQILEGGEEHLTAEEKARRERMRSTARGIASYRLSKDGRHILVPLSGRLFVIELASGDVKELASEAGYPIDPQFSPDASRVACVRQRELYVIDVATGEERRITHGATEDVSNGLAEFVAQEEMGRFRGYWWSPDGSKIAYQQTDTSKLETMHIMDATHPEREPSTWPYPRPGKVNADVKLGIIDARGGETVWVQWDRGQYPYLATVKWRKNSPLTLVVQNREQTEHALLAVDPESGYTTTLHVERDEAWINLDQTMPYWLDDGRAFFWTTERNGSWQIELRSRDGKLLAEVTPVDFGYHGFVSYDHAANTLYIEGSDDPTEEYVYRVKLDPEPTPPERLSEEPGSHSVRFGRDHSVYVHTFQGVNGVITRRVMRADGEQIGELASMAEEPPFMPNVELTKVGTNPYYHAAVIRPRNFDPSIKYPVIVYVYGGPHARMVHATPRGYLLQQWMADHGFVVVTLDGRGTPARGRAWERAIKFNLIDLPLEDQVRGLQALGAKYPEMDLTRVGIYGWSFGGYFSAMAVMRRGDVYRAGVAGAPVADWMDYDTHYTERYMGLPSENPEGYKASSVLTYADQLERPLLIIHGAADDNVYFMHSLKMSDGLFRAGKLHELLVLSDFTHMVADPLVTMRLNKRIIEFFQTRLGGWSM